VDCNKCHTGGDYSNTSTDCYSCHRKDFESSLNPNHRAANFNTQCTNCHTTTPGWKPAEFTEHDALYFPIYSGSHKKEWMECKDCHLNSSNYREFSCVVCHKDPAVSEEHKNVHGYFFNDNACLACHPTGNKADNFNHNNTAFPLTGEHQQVECKLCHTSVFKGTSTVCSDCHLLDFNGSTNPNHKSLGLSMDCATCHTTQPDWKPARFDNHDSYYTLLGAHKPLANDCALCHKGDYNNTPNTCAGCHIEDYNNTIDPPHKSQQFSTDCASCHKESAWVPATFEHDGQYFPIYSGKHKGQWMKCSDCHINPGNIKEFSCVVCHTNPETDNQHTGVNGYWYNDQACFACHPHGDKQDNFDHNTTAFPLTGAHQQVDCKNCHTAGFKGTPKQCLTCHIDDYNSSINPNHKNLGLTLDCESCHTTAPDWKPASFAIHDQYYPIAGAHKAIAMDCAKCHNGDYNNTPNNCAGCHLDDYNKTLDPNHKVLQFSTDCASCHMQSAWAPSTFDHDSKHFPIYSGKHQGVWTECKDCHTNPTNINVFSCTNCHTNPETNDAHISVSGYFYNDQACFACHPNGRKDDKFDHNTTAFPLTGAHTQTECIKCHLSGFKGTSTLCADCHKMDFDGSTNPNHQSLGFSMDCSSCHTTNPDWKPAKLDNHDQFYPLKGAHKMIANDCATCHKGNYTNTPKTCAGCHIEDYNQTKDPPHMTSQFSTDCASCHTETAWKPTTFDHDGSFFPIYSGKHKGLWTECKDCHENPGNFKEFTCTGCHVNPETDNKHVGVGGYFYNSQACFGCHPNGDKNDMFDHNATNFPLTGAHLQVDCKSCHTSGFKGTPTNCESCHLTDFNGSTNPNHVSLGFSTDCIICHTTAPDWKPAKLDNHDQYYALTGAHIAIKTDCNACHKGDYNNTPTDCEGCHITDYNQSQNPKHLDLAFPTDCKMCHTTNPDWKPATFPIHDNYYVLTGAHLNIKSDCAACHHGNYNNTPNTCEGCHQTDYNQSKNPNHVNLGLPTDCAMCHTTQAGWAPAQMPNHDTYYPLTGAHQTIASNCAACHNGNYNNTPNTCQGCHLNDYNQSANPNHVNLGIPNDCALCHTTNPDWKPAAFPIHDNYYVLTGAHLQIASDCAACHNGNYNNTPNTCQGCHMSDYNGSTNPNHQNLGLPTDCAQCHTTNPGWEPALFPNHNNYYPLNGAHAQIANDCAICHNGNYNNTPNTCVGCHLNDYNQTSNPDHQVQQFPTDCASCHTETAWIPSTFNHNNYYPLTGAHASIADNCIICHNGNYNNTPNTCNGCHLTDFNQATNPNHNTLGFSHTCDLCHTTAPGWAPASMPTHNNYWPLLGAHLAIKNDCAACHNGNYNNTPNTCVGCHLDDYNNTSNPDHQTAQFPTDCQTCHTVNAWIPSTFNHDGLYFPIYSGKHKNEWNICADCHTNSSNYNVFSCILCHEHNNKNEVDNDHNGVSGYSYNSAACYSCHPKGKK
jgi:hypothetical protein